VRAHCARMQLRRGESVFEAGSAAGAFVDSLSRQYGVRVAGVDLAPSLVAVARRRVFRGAGRPEFCAASAHILKSAFLVCLHDKSPKVLKVLTYEVLFQAGNLSFIPDASFDHAVSFAVMMYISDASMACRIASELVRIVKPGTYPPPHMACMYPPPHMACMYPPLHMTCMYPPPHMTCMVRTVKPGGKILIAQANDPVKKFKKKIRSTLYIDSYMQQIH
jgi:ubiquinone/menaquinone biosynthesis C-methylase UbiE